MLNIVELENRWLRYKIKSYLPYLSILILFLITIVSILFFSSKSNTDATKNPPVVHSTDKIPQKKETIKELPLVVQEKKQTKLTPSFEFMKNMQNTKTTYYKRESFTPKKVETKKVQKKEIAEVSTPDLNKISIKRKNTDKDIQDIIKRFKNNNNPALSLFVAKKYYELGNYHQAYNYALITNKINKEIEISWIIFTKSLVKLGQKDKALSILKKYISQSHSSNAQILLDEIKSGKFK